MKLQRALELMDIELSCINRNIEKTCDRHCEKCDLVQEDKDLIEAYQIAKYAIIRLMKTRESP
jgi:hypothetical protein